MIEKIRIKGYRIYNNFTMSPNTNFNLIIGDNESGKSTLIEALTLALTGRINGQWASEELNPYWFNTDIVQNFLEKRSKGQPISLPEISIELFLENRDDLQQLCGAVNSDVPTNACPGVTFRVQPSSDYTSEIEEWSKKPSRLLPVEYYETDWRSFADKPLTRRPHLLKTAIIDSRTVRSSSGVDYHMRQILQDHLEPEERAAISLTYRQVKASMSDEVLKSVNEQMEKDFAPLHDKAISLAMDQSTRTSWEGAVTPHVQEVPFSMSGQGQQAAIKISLAMSRHSDRTSFVMIEEPENHLAYGNLTSLLSRVESLASDHQQLFITTHSSFVLNRLGIDTLHLLHHGDTKQFKGLDPETVTYFKKLPGHDTLRMVLSDKLVLVEGPSDEILFERIFKDIHGKRPMEVGIDILSIRGVSFARCLELCHALNKKVAVVRDNDGADPNELRTDLEKWLVNDQREAFIGEGDAGRTLEPQLVHFNGETKLRRILKIPPNASIEKWMSREKTMCALNIAESSETITPPSYMKAAAEFIYE